MSLIGVPAAVSLNGLMICSSFRKWTLLTSAWRGSGKHLSLSVRHWLGCLMQDLWKCGPSGIDLATVAFASVYDAAQTR